MLSPTNSQTTIKWNTALKLTRGYNSRIVNNKLKLRITELEDGDYQWLVKRAFIDPVTNALKIVDTDADAISADTVTVTGNKTELEISLIKGDYEVNGVYVFSLQRISDGEEGVRYVFEIDQDVVWDSAGTVIKNFFSALYTLSGNAINSVTNKIVDQLSINTSDTLTGASNDQVPGALAVKNYVDNVTVTVDLDYNASSTDGEVTNTAGSNATIPLVDSSNAGLMSPTQNDKLAGIDNGAEVNVNADWNAVSGNAEILNKPILSTVATSGDHTDLSNKGTNTHSQIDSFINSKANASGLASLDGSGKVPFVQIPDSVKKAYTTVGNANADYVTSDYSNNFADTINAAGAALTSSGGVVIVKRASYTINKSIILYSNVIYRFQNSLITASTTGFPHFVSHLDGIGELQDCQVYDVRITGDDKSVADSGGYKLFKPTRVNIFNTRTANCFEAVKVTGGSRTLNLHNVYIGWLSDTKNNYGVVFDEGTDANGNIFTMYNCKISGCDNAGLISRDGNPAYILNCDITGNNVNLDLKSSVTTVFIGNTIDSGIDTSILIKPDGSGFGASANKILKTVIDGNWVTGDESTTSTNRLLDIDGTFAGSVIEGLDIRLSNSFFSDNPIRVNKIRNSFISCAVVDANESTPATASNIGVEIIDAETTTFELGLIKNANIGISAPESIFTGSDNCRIKGDLAFENVTTAFDSSAGKLPRVITTNRLEIARNNSSNADDGQVLITDPAERNKGFTLGYNTSADEAYLKSRNKGVSTLPIGIEANGVSLIGSNNFFHFGNKDTDGTVRLRVSSGQLVAEKRTAGVYGDTQTLTSFT